MVALRLVLFVMRLTLNPVPDNRLPEVPRGFPLKLGALQRLAELPQVAGVKHAPGAIDADTMAMMAGRPAGFSVLAGDCVLAPALLALGAEGAISAAAHVCTRSYADLVRAWRAGDSATARPLGHRLAALSAVLFAEPSPAVIKAVLHRHGLIASPRVRLPLLPAGQASVQAALSAAAAVGTGL